MKIAANNHITGIAFTKRTKREIAKTIDDLADWIDELEQRIIRQRKVDVSLVVITIISLLL